MDYLPEATLPKEVVAVCVSLNILVVFTSRSWLVKQVMILSKLPFIFSLHNSLKELSKSSWPHLILTLGMVYFLILLSRAKKYFHSLLWSLT